MSLKPVFAAKNEVIALGIPSEPLKDSVGSGLVKNRLLLAEAVHVVVVIFCLVRLYEPRRAV